MGSSESIFKSCSPKCFKLCAWIMPRVDVCFTLANPESAIHAEHWIM